MDIKEKAPVEKKPRDTKEKEIPPAPTQAAKPWEKATPEKKTQEKKPRKQKNNQPDATASSTKTSADTSPEKKKVWKHIPSAEKKRGTTDKKIKETTDKKKETKTMDSETKKTSKQTTTPPSTKKAVTPINLDKKHSIAPLSIDDITIPAPKQETTISNIPEPEKKITPPINVPKSTQDPLATKDLEKKAPTKITQPSLEPEQTTTQTSINLDTLISPDHTIASPSPQTSEKTVPTIQQETNNIDKKHTKPATKPATQKSTNESINLDTLLDTSATPQKEKVATPEKKDPIVPEHKEHEPQQKQPKDTTKDISTLLEDKTKPVSQKEKPTTVDNNSGTSIHANPDETAKKNGKKMIFIIKLVAAGVILLLLIGLLTLMFGGKKSVSLDKELP